MPRRQDTTRERDQATKELRRAEKNTRTAADEVARLESMPNSITVRDVTMDSIATCLKLTLLSLLTFITQEYFGLRFEPRTFIEEFVRLPVRLVETKTTVCYQLQENIRSPKRMLELRAACEEINRRGIHHRKRRLVFEVVPRREPPDQHVRAVAHTWPMFLSEVGAFRWLLPPELR